MNREKALVKNTIILGLGTFIPQLFNFITIPILTRYLSTDEYGIYDLLLTIVGLLLPIVTLQIQAAGFRYLIDTRDDMERCRVIVSNILVFVTSVSMITLTAFFLVLKNQSPLLKILICLYLFLDVLYNCIGQIARGLSDNVGYAIGALVLSAGKTILIVILVAWNGRGIYGIVFSFVLAYLFADLTVAARIQLHKYIKMSVVSFAEMKKLLKYSWPLVPNNLSSWVLYMSDRLVITCFLGTSVNAIYAAANNIPNMVNVARSVLIMAWQENASMAVGDKDAESYFTKMHRTIYSMIVGITAFLIGITPVLFKILIRGNYAEAYNQIPILFMGVFFGCISSFQAGIYVAHMKTLEVGISTFICAVINLALDFAMIESIGIYAGSVSTVVSYFFLFLYRLTDIKKFQKIIYDYKEIIGGVCILTVMAVLSSMNNIWVNMLNFIIGCVLAVVGNRGIIMEKRKGKSKNEKD